MPLGFVRRRLVLSGELAPRAGFEPATIRLTVECSTAELPRNRAKPEGLYKGSQRAAYNKALPACKAGNRPLRRPAMFIRKPASRQRVGRVFATVETRQSPVSAVPSSGRYRAGR